MTGDIFYNCKDQKKITLKNFIVNKFQNLELFMDQSSFTHLAKTKS